MKRYICVLAIIIILIIIGLHNLGVVFFDYNKVYALDGNEGIYEAMVLSKKSETDYKITYIIKLQNNLNEESANKETANKNSVNEESTNKKDKNESNEIFSEKKFLLDIKKKDFEDELDYGTIIEFNGVYNKPNSKRNYEGYDYSLYLKTQSIYGNFKGTNVNVKIKNKGNFINRCIISFKTYIKSVLEANLEENEANLCIGLLIGDRTNLDEEIEEDFKTSNLTHMLAVSGSHFVYIILAMTYITKLFKRKRLGQIIMLIAIILFMNLTGNTGSVVRSGIMAILGVVASLLYRKSDMWTNMSIAILIQVIINPYIIFDIGVQLSYGGVIGIVLFNDIINDRLVKICGLFRVQKEGIRNKVIKYVYESISVTLSANIVIIPIMMLNFNTISLSFVISNLLAGSIMGVLVIYAFILVFLSIIFKTLISPLFIILNLMLKLLIFIAHICSLLPFSKIYVVTPNIVLIIAFYVIIYLFYKQVNNKEGKIRQKNILVISLIVVILINFIFPVITSKRKHLEINFIDVGQGDSTLIRVNNKNILIDGGGSSYGEKFDVGERILFPYLLDRGINKLDYVIVSHFDSDHCQGLNFVMENMKVENAIISSLGQESSEYNTFISLAQKQNTNLIFVKKGDRIKIGNSLIQILYPGNELITDNAKNNNAIVFKFIWKNISILFTGDIEEKAENMILNLYEDNLEELEATILKVAHHGSKTSTTKAFLEAVNPKIALIGVGKDNNFGHPNGDVLERLKSIGCKIYRTDECGEITITCKNGLKIHEMLSMK